MISEQKRNIRELDSSYNRKYEKNTEEVKRRKRGLIRRLSALFIIGAAIGSVTIMTIHTQAKSLNEIEEQKQALELELKQLEAEQAFLEQEIINYNDLDYIAEIARRDYFLSKEGEILFKLPKASSD
ncbi:septum formation initiator family protein [Alkalihalobacillus sp. LMS39]|uniref:FtsB family cell division protein n=1 Tax=Alkalihalobacillus sp. LMS39 TaxID=2924032 RepID=UPI001FB2E2B9|nr:septum formation initiator family protein [Alkalihalobacillus sp. LMS39]UOE94200.1 septum formation initiator family protein [Alkalihalobacillus sp. LMS39]